jgi:hypothetical protein
MSNYSAKLDTTAILINKPWAIIDEEFEMQKLIFKKDKELILSKNGQVQIGKWDYFPEAKSLLIDRNVDKILCNEAFIDQGVMILKLDGTENRFFILANENIVPDLDVNRYLKELRYQKLKIVERELVDGRILEVQRYDEFSNISIANRVSMEADLVVDGIYKIANSQYYYEIEKSRIKKILTETRYFNPEGHEIVIQQQRSNKIFNGDYVFMYGNQVGTSIINFSKSKNLVVRDGKVVRLERKNPLTRWFSKVWKSIFSYYEA